MENENLKSINQLGKILKLSYNTLNVLLFRVKDKTIVGKTKVGSRTLYDINKVKQHIIGRSAKKVFVHTDYVSVSDIAKEFGISRQGVFSLLVNHKIPRILATPRFGKDDGKQIGVIAKTDYDKLKGLRSSIKTKPKK